MPWKSDNEFVLKPHQGLQNLRDFPVSSLCLEKWHLPSQSCTKMDLWCGGFSKPVVWPFTLDIKDLRFSTCEDVNLVTVEVHYLPISVYFRVVVVDFPLLSLSSSWINQPLKIPYSNSNYRMRDPWLVSPDILHRPDLHAFFPPFNAPGQVQGLEYLFYEGRLQELVLFSLKPEKGSH